MAHPTLLRIANTLVYVFFLSSSIYDVAGPEAAYGYAKHPTYITPAPFAFAIWGLIHALFFGFIIWQWFGTESEDIVVEGYGSYFVIAGLLTALWNRYWDSGHLIMAFIILIFASLSVSTIYHNLSSRKPQTLSQKLFVHAPVSLFHGFLVVITCINAFAIFSTTHDNAHPSLLASIFAFLDLMFLTSVALGYSQLRSEHGDLAGAFVIAWSLFAISVEQQAPIIRWSALAMGLIVVATPLIPQLDSARKRLLGTETQPLLGGGNSSVV